MNLPLALTDSQLALIQQAAEPIAPKLRSAFLEQVAHLLAGASEIGDGAIARACRAAQAEFRHARPWHSG
jgi:hypothetical protein